MAVELRHRSWSDAAPAIFDLLHEHGAAWTQIDEPKFRFSVRQDLMPNMKGFYYMRLHGRNAEQWWEHENAEDRYNYLYSEAELRPIAKAVRTARALVKKQYIYLNNHFAAQAIADAAVLRHMLDEPVAEPMPAELVSALSDAQGQSRYFSPFTVALIMRSPTSIFDTTSMPGRDFAEDGVAAVKARDGRERRRTIGCRPCWRRRRAPSRRRRARACATWRTRRRQSACRSRRVPHASFLAKSREAGSPTWTTKSLHDAMKALAVVEALSHELENARDGLRRFVGIGLELERALLGLNDDNGPGPGGGLGGPLGPERQARPPAR